MPRRRPEDDLLHNRLSREHRYVVVPKDASPDAKPLAVGDSRRLIAERLHKRMFPPGERLADGRGIDEKEFKKHMYMHMFGYDRPLAALAAARLGRHLLRNPVSSWKDAVNSVYDPALHKWTNPDHLLKLLGRMQEAGLADFRGDISRVNSHRHVRLSDYFARNPGELKEMAAAIEPTRRPTRSREDARKANIAALKKMGLWSPLKDRLGKGGNLDRVMGNLALFQAYGQRPPRGKKARILLKSPQQVILDLEGLQSRKTTIPRPPIRSARTPR